MVLLVVDTQKLITNKELYNFDLFVSNVKKLINTARKSNIEVIYVRHDDGIGQELTRTYDYYNKFMWKGRYANCVSMEKALELMKS